MEDFAHKFVQLLMNIGTLFSSSGQSKLSGHIKMMILKNMLAVGA